MGLLILMKQAILQYSAVATCNSWNSTGAALQQFSRHPSVPSTKRVNPFNIMRQYESNMIGEGGQNLSTQHINWLNPSNLKSHSINFHFIKFQRKALLNYKYPKIHFSTMIPLPKKRKPLNADLMDMQSDRLYPPKTLREYNIMLNFIEQDVE